MVACAYWINGGTRQSRADCDVVQSLGFGVYS